MSFVARRLAAFSTESSDETMFYRRVTVYSRPRSSLVTALLFAVCFNLCSVAVAQAQYLWNDNPPDEPHSAQPNSDGVTASGAATYTVPIVVPQTRGPVPNIALLYNSQSSNGVAGMGWAIAGISAIIRSPGDAGITFIATDSYSYLPAGWGSLAHPDNLLVTKGTDRYHLARNIAGAPLIEFQAVGTGCGSGPCYFIGRDGRGNTYYFGGDDQHLATGGSTGSALWEPNNGVTSGRGIVAWALYRMVDVDGNYYRVDYANDSQTLYPQEIHYNLPIAQGSGRTLAVEFLYAARSDVTPMPGHLTRRLYRVNVFANCPGAILNCSLLRRYELGHTISRYGNSLLTSITEYGSNSLAHGLPGDTSGGGLPSSTFTYTTSGGVAASTRDQTNPFGYIGYPTWNDDRKWQSHVGDIDGDGRADLVRVHLGTDGQKVQFTCAAKDNSGFTGAVQTLTDSSASAQPLGLSLLADVNGDGKLDLVIAYPSAVDHTIEVYVAFGASGCSLGTWSDLLASKFAGHFDRTKPFSADISRWRLLAADINGDGKSDLVLYDDGSDAPSRTLYTALSMSSGGSVRFGDFKVSTWRPFSDGGHTGSFPTDHTFNGIIVADLNGDGYSDVLASWSGAPAYSWPGNSEPSQLTVMTAYGSPTGLGIPSEYSELGSVRWPFLALRGGDINGDGLPDILLNFQGRPDPAGGVSNGRDLRNRLSAAGTGPNPFQVAGQDQYTYPYASTSENPPHLNNWEFLTGDINGDGIDDFVEFYCGYYGRRLAYGLGTPTGMVLANGFYLIGHPISNDTTGLFGDSYGPVRKWLSALGDLDGDGKADFVIAQYSAGASPDVHFVLGTTGGLSPDLVPLSNLSTSLATGDFRYLSIRVADINADGRADIILIDDNGDEAGSSRVTYALSPDPSSDAGIPDLLKTANNGVGGITTLTYILAREYDAVQPDLKGPGHPNTRPRALVSAIMHDNSAGLADAKRYGYVNGRVLAGRPSQRADLGFERIREYSYVGTNMAALADLNRTLLPMKRDTFYRQDKPYQGLVGRVEDRMIDGTPLRILTNTYDSAPPVPNVANVARQTVQVDTYEQQGVLVRSTSISTTWNLATLSPTETIDHVIFPAGDNDIVTDVWYAADDKNNWIVGKPVGRVQYRLSSTAGSVSLLDKTQVSYDTTLPLHFASSQTLLLTSGELLCTRTSDPAALCNAEAAAGSGYLVTTFQNPSYDAYGNLTYTEGTYTGTPEQIRTGNAHKHQIYLTYDSAYQGLVAARTNALGHVTTIANDPAFGVLSVRDANGSVWSTIYDTYGRPNTVTKPGTSSIVNAEWLYLGLTSDGYLIRKRTYSSGQANPPTPAPGPSPAPGPPAPAPASPPEPHEIDVYLDGFGRLVRTVDHSSTGDITRSIQQLFDQPTSQLVSRATLPYFSGEPIKYLETRFDLRQRPVVRSRLDATGAVEKQLATYSYNQDGSIVATDANGRQRRVNFNARNKVASEVDAAGNTAQYIYNNALKLVQVTLPSGQTGNVVRWGYDGWGRKTFESDPAAGYTTYLYDPVGNLIQLTRAATDQGPVTSQVQYTYDGLDRVITEGDGVSTKVGYAYDNYQGLGPLGGNPVGRLTGVVDPSGSTFFTYDARGNVAQKFVTLNGLNGLCIGGAGPPICGSFEYDFSYDDQDRLLTKTFPAFPTSSSARAVQKFIYSKDGLLTDISHDGVRYAHYSDFNALKQVGAKWLYEFCFIAANCVFANKTTYGYQADHRLESMRTTTADPNPSPVGVTSTVVVQDDTYGYDPIGNLMAVTDNRAPSAKAYTYSTGSTTVSINTDHGARFTYDALDRLKTWVPSSSGSAGIYAYDAMGNIMGDSGTIVYTSCGTASAPARCITKYAGGRFAFVPLSHGRLIPLIVWSAVHDGEGKRTKFFLGADGHTDSYAYDYKQRLIRVTRDGNPAWQERYQYNYAGERTQKVFSQGGRSTTTWFVGLDFEVQQSSSDPAGSYSATYYVGNVAAVTVGSVIDGQAPEPMVVANEGKAMTGDLNRGNAQGTYLRIEDRLGSTAIITYPQRVRAPVFVEGTEVSRYAYDPWGQRLLGISSSDAAHHETGYDTTTVQFTGQRHDDSSGLMYYRGRYYDPRSRRFITADDRIVPSAGAQGFNRYAYVLNNPLRYVDPTGHSPVVSPATDGSGNIVGIDVSWRQVLLTAWKGYRLTEGGGFPAGPGLTGTIAGGAGFTAFVAGKLIEWTLVPEVYLATANPFSEIGFKLLFPMTDTELLQGVTWEFWLDPFGVEAVVAASPWATASLWLQAGPPVFGILGFDWAVLHEVYTVAAANYRAIRNPSWCVNVAGTAGCQHERDAAAFSEALGGMQMSPELKAAFAAQFQRASGPLVSHPPEVRTSSSSAPSGARSGGGGNPGGSSGGRAAGPSGARGNPGEGSNREPPPNGPGADPSSPPPDCGILCDILGL